MHLYEEGSEGLIRRGEHSREGVKLQLLQSNRDECAGI